MAQTEFDRQAEVTRLLLEGISSTHVLWTCGVAQNVETRSVKVRAPPSGPHSSTSAPHCLQEEEQSKEGACTHLRNKPSIPTEEFGSACPDPEKLWQQSGSGYHVS